MADNNLQASFKKLMRYAQNLAEYEQGIAEGIIDENVFVIVLDEKVAKFKGQTFDWSGGGSGNGGDFEVRTVYPTKQTVLEEETFDITDEERAYNMETLSKTLSGKTVFCKVGEAILFPTISMSGAVTEATYSTVVVLYGSLASYSLTITSDGDAEVAIAEVTTGGGGGSDIVVDSAMSPTSTNPVQNKVVYSEFQKKQNMISDLADIRSGAALGKTALQQADIADLATKDDITNLTNEIITNEKIHAAALNDLNERLNNGGESSGGSGVVTFYIPSGETVTDEEIAKNKAAYEAYVASYTNPPIVRLSYLDIPMHLYAAMSSYDIESNKVVVGIIHQADVIRQTVYMIGADGSVMIQS